MTASSNLLTLIEQWSYSFVNSEELVAQILLQAKAEGIEKDELRPLVEKSLERRGLEERAIRNALPAELKEKNMVRSKPKLEKIAALTAANITANAGEIIEYHTTQELAQGIADSVKQIAETVQPPVEPDNIDRPDEQSTDENDDGTEEYHGDAGNNPALIKKYVDDKPLKRKVLMPKKFLGTLFAIKTNFTSAQDYDILLTVEGDKVTEVSNRPIMRAEAIAK